MTRRLAGVHPMTSGDWKAGVRHCDEVGVSPSPSQKFPTVSVPYSALLPERLDGVVVGGRHVASDAATQAFMREIPQCWMTGQAAGTAAGRAAAPVSHPAHSTSPNSARSSAGRARSCTSRSRHQLPGTTLSQLI